jgi:aryl-alcohol dehydrogenase-like predicted oxidoreductase
MRYRKLGTSDLQVSEIALGSWLTTAGGLEKAQAIAVVRAALDAGITLIDTANIYGRGVSETVLGEALAGVKRDSYILATKLYFPMTPTDKGLSRAQIIKQLDASLERMRTSYVDLYQCHRYDAETPLEETMAALDEVVRQGKARWIGFSEWPADKIAASLKLSDQKKSARFVSSQPQYSMLHRAPEAEVIPLCRREKVSQIVWSPLAQGVLTGKYRPDAPPPADSRAMDQKMNVHFRQDLMTRPVLEAVQAMGPLAQQAGLSIAQFALAWVLRDQNVAAAIIGASRPDQVQQNAAAAGRNVDPALFAKAEALLAKAQAAKA